MIRNEPNTNTTETGKSETVASPVDLCEPQLGHAGSSLTEEFIEGRHFVCAIDEVNHEHVRGFPVEIDLEGPPNDDDEDSGYVPTPEHEKDEAMPSELGERKEVIPQEPESDFSEDFEEPQLLGSLLRQHEARGQVVTLVYRLVEGLLLGDVVMKEEMIKVLHLPQWQQTLPLLLASTGEFLLS